LEILKKKVGCDGRKRSPILELPTVLDKGLGEKLTVKYSGIQGPKRGKKERPAWSTNPHGFGSENKGGRTITVV